MEDKYVKMINKFTRFADCNITETEILAAAEVLKRELGRAPTLYEIAEYIEDQIRWRHFHRKWRNGEIVIKHVYTKKGKRLRRTEARINNIFHEKGGD